jgi:uncharacterized membrane protein (DUF4010 family)
VILALLAPLALARTLVPFALMCIGAVAIAFIGGPRPPADATVDHTAGPTSLRSPFSLSAALQFGLIFLALQIAGTLAERALGDSAFYAVSAVGGMVSSASAVATAAALGASGTLPPHTAGMAAMLASLTSALVNIPLVSRLVKHASLTRWIVAALAVIGALGILGVLGQSVIDAAR